VGDDVHLEGDLLLARVAAAATAAARVPAAAAGVRQGGLVLLLPEGAGGHGRGEEDGEGGAGEPGHHPDQEQLCGRGEAPVITGGWAGRSWEHTPAGAAWLRPTDLARALASA